MPDPDDAVDYTAEHQMSQHMLLGTVRYPQGQQRTLTMDMAMAPGFTWGSSL